eukprot:scaffold19736_cov112-Isochrysis_galbana.AAC.1
MPQAAAAPEPAAPFPALGDAPLPTGANPAVVPPGAAAAALTAAPAAPATPPACRAPRAPMPSLRAEASTALACAAGASARPAAPGPPVGWRRRRRWPWRVAADPQWRRAAAQSR